jgi:hypothetical protein
VVPPEERGDERGLLDRAVLVHEENVDRPALLARAHGAHRQVRHAVACSERKGMVVVVCVEK